MSKEFDENGMPTTLLWTRDSCSCSSSEEVTEASLYNNKFSSKVDTKRWIGKQIPTSIQELKHLAGGLYTPLSQDSIDSFQLLRKSDKNCSERDKQFKLGNQLLPSPSTVKQRVGTIKNLGTKHSNRRLKHLFASSSSTYEFCDQAPKHYHDLTLAGKQKQTKASGSSKKAVGKRGDESSACKPQVFYLYSNSSAEIDLGAANSKKADSVAFAQDGTHSTAANLKDSEKIFTDSVTSNKARNGAALDTTIVDSNYFPKLVSNHFHGKTPSHIRAAKASTLRKDSQELLNYSKEKIMSSSKQQSKEKRSQNNSTVDRNIVQLEEGYQSACSSLKKPMPLESIPYYTKAVENAQRSNITVENEYYTWEKGKALIQSFLWENANDFKYKGVPYTHWELKRISTLGASKFGGRYQEMFKVRLSTEQTLFLKKIPYHIWEYQYKEQEKWKGTYIEYAENYVNEAAAQAFLTRIGSDLVPPLIALLKEKKTTSKEAAFEKFPRNDYSNAALQAARTLPYIQPNHGRSDATHIVIVSEFYGQSLLEFISNLNAKGQKVSSRTKRMMQRGIIDLVNCLHLRGLAHLDLTPENLLVSVDYISQDTPLLTLKLCDFGKAAPLEILPSKKLKHFSSEKNVNDLEHGAEAANAVFSALKRIAASHNISESSSNKKKSTVFPFYCCIPTVGKGAYMPPECWKIIDECKPQSLTASIHYANCLRNYSDTKNFKTFFSVSKADIFMCGVLLCWLWTDGYLWDVSSTKRDSRYSMLLQSNYNFAKTFKKCNRSWPEELTNLLSGMLKPLPHKRQALTSLLNHAWFQ